MVNQLSLPLAPTHPADIRGALRAYIHAKHPETHPDAFLWDIGHWENLRKAALTSEIHEDRVSKIIIYHAHLVFILTKLPPDIGLSITYDTMFSDSAITLQDLHYERISLLLNLSVLLCQLGTIEDRSSLDGIKRAVALFGKSAGTLAYAISDALPPFIKSIEKQGVSLPPELNETVLSSFRSLMLAQKQECAWQSASLNQYKNTVLAKLASGTSSLYGQALDYLNKNHGALSKMPRSWAAHLETKKCHFEAVSQFRQSLEDNVGRKYGIELSRLGIASAAVKNAAEIAKRGGVARAVLDDAKSLVAAVQASMVEAEKNNDLIYHQDIPPRSKLPTIDATIIANQEIIAGLQNPAAYLERQGVHELVFGGLEGWGIRRACEIYYDRRNNWIQEELVESQQELDRKTSNILNSLNLPGSLDALSQPIGLPPSLLSKAERVRQEDGPNRLGKMFKDVSKLSAKCHDLLNSCFDLLDVEAEEDEELRNAYARYDNWTRPESTDANKSIVNELKRHNEMLIHAAKSDTAAQKKWDIASNKIMLLSQDTAAIESTIPKTTYSAQEASSSSTRTQTQLAAASLRHLLEELDDFQLARKHIVDKAQRIAATDDIKPNILRQVTSSVRRNDAWADVNPAMFGDAIDAGLDKYEGFKSDMHTNGTKLEEVLEILEDRNRAFLESRKIDPSIKAREIALQQLDIAYQDYRDITQHLEQGIKFYNDFTGIMTKIKATTQEWIEERRNGVSWLFDSLHPMSPSAEADVAADLKELNAPEAPAMPSKAAGVTALKARTRSKTKALALHSAAAATGGEKSITVAATAVCPPDFASTTTTSRKPPLSLPNPNSSAWEASELAPPPPPATKKTRRKKDTA